MIVVRNRDLDVVQMALVREDHVSLSLAAPVVQQFAHLGKSRFELARLRRSKIHLAYGVRNFHWLNFGPGAD